MIVSYKYKQINLYNVRMYYNTDDFRVKLSLFSNINEMK
jgi:hypothetical protein